VSAARFPSSEKAACCRSQCPNPVFFHWEEKVNPPCTDADSIESVLIGNRDPDEVNDSRTCEKTSRNSLFFVRLGSPGWGVDQENSTCLSMEFTARCKTVMYAGRWVVFPAASMMTLGRGGK